MSLRVKPGLEVISAARPLFYGKRKSIGGLAKSAIITVIGAAL